MGGFAIWWNLIVVAIEFVFRQKPEVISRTYNQHKGTFYETTEVTVADVAPNKVKVVEAAIKRICWLLSFAGTCQVIPFEYEYPNGSGLGHSISASGEVQDFRPAFEMVDGAQLKSFVEQTYENYTRLELSRKMNVVIAYLAQAVSLASSGSSTAVLWRCNTLQCELIWADGSGFATSVCTLLLTAFFVSQRER